MSWRYPDASMEPAAAAALAGAGTQGPLVMAHRRGAWEEAARCLLGAVRSCSCDAFYLTSPPVRRAS